MKKDRDNGYYAELENLFVEHELDDNTISIINVQLKHPADPENTDLWVDITDHCSQGALDQLIGQIEDYYIDQHHMREARLEDAAKARREFALEMQREALNQPRGVKL